LKALCKKLLEKEGETTLDVKDFPKITVILRGYTYEQVRTVVEVLAESPVNSVEIALNTKDAVQTIKKISKEFGNKILIGAGTVLSIEQAVKSVEAGAKFLLSPVMMPKEILSYCSEKHVVSIPSAFSPTEIYKAFRDGANIIKVFPAARLGSKYFSDVLAPLGDIPLMAVGGVNADNAAEFLKAGAKFLGIGSGLFKKEDVIRQNIQGLRNSIMTFIEKLK